MIRYGTIREFEKRIKEVPGVVDVEISIGHHLLNVMVTVMKGYNTDNVAENVRQASEEIVPAYIGVMIRTKEEKRSTWKKFKGFLGTFRPRLWRYLYPISLALLYTIDCFISEHKPFYPFALLFMLLGCIHYELVELNKKK